MFFPCFKSLFYLDLDPSFNLISYNLERPKPRPSFSHFGSRNHILFFSCHSLCFFLYLLHFSHFISFSSFTLSLSTTPNTITIIATFHHQPPLTPPINSNNTALIDDNTFLWHLSLILFLSLYHFHSHPFFTTTHHIDSIGVTAIGSPLHPCATFLLSPLSIFVSPFLYFFFISYPFSHAYPHHSTSPPSLVPLPTADASQDLFSDHHSPHFHVFFSLSDQAQWCWSTFRYIFFLIFIFFSSFSTYLFHPNYLLFYRYLFQNVGLLFIFLSFLVLLFIVWMNNL